MGKFLFWATNTILSTGNLFFKAFVLYLGAKWFISEPLQVMIIPYYVFIFAIYAHAILSVPLVIAAVFALIRPNDMEEEEKFVTEIKSIISTGFGILLNIIALGFLYLLKVLLVP